MSITAYRPCLALALGLALLGPCAAADWEFGVHGTAMFGDGVPSNDVMGVGFTARRDMGDWVLGIGLDRTEWDFEGPAELVGITQDPAVDTIDATVEQIDLSLWYERRFGDEDELHGTWSFGGGVGRPDVGPASGPVDGGGTFDVRTDAATEPFLFAALGFRVPLGDAWTFETTGRYEYRMTDFQLEDRNSGARGEVGSHRPLGVHFGFSRRF